MEAIGDQMFVKKFYRDEYKSNISKGCNSNKKLSTYSNWFPIMGLRFGKLLKTHSVLNRFSLTLSLKRTNGYVPSSTSSDFDIVDPYSVIAAQNFLI